MFLTVGEISRILGISAETIRYYVKEGIITPQKNKENNYWAYSSEDLMKLTDVLFYRNMHLTMRDIKEIMNDLPLAEIGRILDGRKNELIREIKTCVDALNELAVWEEKYKEEIRRIGKFEIGAMPSEFRRDGCLEEAQHMARYLEQCFDLDKEDWGSVSISFFYDLRYPEAGMQRYLSIEGSLKVKPSNTRRISATAIEEKAECCLITEVHYSDDVQQMIEPMIEYAKEQGLLLEGTFYGREDTNYYIKGKRTGLYKVYAPIKR